MNKIDWKNPEKRKEYHRLKTSEYRKNNLEKVKNQIRIWQKNNPNYRKEWLAKQPENYVALISAKYIKKYPWKRHLITIKQRCNNPKNISYKYYGGIGIKCLITAEQLKKLWRKDKAYNMKKPTVDRMNPKGHYTYKNCQFLELSDNCKKLWVQNNITRKPVGQYSLSNKIINIYISQSEAFRQTGISQGNIASCCRKERNNAGGYVWKFINLRPNKGIA